MRYRTALGVTLLMSATGFSQEKPAAPITPLTFGDAHLTVPPGWRHIETHSGANKAGALLILPPDNTEKTHLAILVLPGQELKGADFPQTFDRVVKNALAPNERLLQYSELPLRKAAGYDFLTRSMVIGDDAGRRNVRVCFGANPMGRLEILIVSADSMETLKHYQAEVGSLLQSYSFGEGSVTAGVKNGDSAARAPARPDSGVRKTEGSSTALAGSRSRVPEGGSVLVCKDPGRLDFAMENAKNGNSYLALQALRHDAFFRVNGPASLEVRESELKSSWPKVLVTVLDGDSAGRTGWVLLSELKDLKQPGK